VDPDEMVQGGGHHRVPRDLVPVGRSECPDWTVVCSVHGDGLAHDRLRINFGRDSVRSVPTEGLRASAGSGTPHFDQAITERGALALIWRRHRAGDWQGVVEARFVPVKRAFEVQYGFALLGSHDTTG
jgi:hypothetical protein